MDLSLGTVIGLLLAVLVLQFLELLLFELRIVLLAMRRAMSIHPYLPGHQCL